MNAWDRLPAETDKQYNAFRAYLELGPSRSLGETYRRIHGKVKGDAPQFFLNWARAHAWHKRAQSYDIHLIRIREEAEREAIREKVRKAAEKRELAFDVMLNSGMAIFGKAKLADLSPTQARRLLRAAIAAIDSGSKGQRIELGEPTEINQQRVEMSGSMSHDVDVEMDVRLEDASAGDDEEGGDRTIEQFAQFIGALAEAGVVVLALPSEDEPRELPEADQPLSGTATA